MTAVLSTRGLTKEFGAIVAVDDLSFDLREGELLALIGPNGAGKSTCFDMLMGQQKPTRGQVFLDGADITGEATRAIWRKGVGRTFQITATYASMTVVENVQMALMSHRKDLMRLLPYAHNRYRDEALALLEQVHMADQADRHCAVLAYGDLKRMELAIALAHGPKVLLMDEPFSALDPLIRAHLQDELLELQARLKRTIIFVSHDLDEAFKLGDRIAILEGGRIVQAGTPRDIYSNPASEYVADFVDHMNPLGVLTAIDVMTTATAGESHSHSVDADMSVKAVLAELSGGGGTYSVTQNGAVIGEVSRESVIEKLAESG